MFWHVGTWGWDVFCSRVLGRMRLFGFKLVCGLFRLTCWREFGALFCLLFGVFLLTFLCFCCV